MEVQEFLKQIGQTDFQPVYLFGPHRAPRARNATFEPVLADRAVDIMIDALVDPSMKDLCYTAFHGDETSAAEVVETANTLPFLAERRVVLVRNAESYDSESSGKAMLAYLESPCPSTVLIMVAGSVDKRSKFYKACAASGEVVECPQLKEHDVMLWARAEIGVHGKDIDAGAVKLLIDRTGTHLSDVQNAIHAVCNYVGDRSTITEADVMTACADTDEEEVWALTDAIAASDTAKAVSALREIIEPNKNEFQILGSINWLLKSAYAVAAGGDVRTKLNNFVARKVQPLADKLGREKFRDAFSLCIDTDILMRSTGVDRGLALELLVVKLAAPRQRR